MSSGQEIKRGRQSKREEIKRSRQSKREQNRRGRKASRELIRLTFSCFSEAPENYFSKFKVLILQDLPFSKNLRNQARRNSQAVAFKDRLLASSTRQSGHTLIKLLPAHFPRNLRGDLLVIFLLIICNLLLNIL